MSSCHGRRLYLTSFPNTVTRLGQKAHSVTSAFTTISREAAGSDHRLRHELARADSLRQSHSSQRASYAHLNSTDGSVLLATRSDVAARNIITFLPMKAVATMEIHRQLLRSVKDTQGYGAILAI